MQIRPAYVEIASCLAMTGGYIVNNIFSSPTAETLLGEIRQHMKARAVGKGIQIVAKGGL